jgi:hypothetical protein
MGKKIDPNRKIVQRSIGFEFRHHLFFNKYQKFKPDLFCRIAIDEQIKKIDGDDSEFLVNEENELNNEC